MVTVTHRRDNTMATVLTAIVGVFIVCHTPKAALNLYEVGTVGSNFNSLTPWWFWSGATSQILSVYRSWSPAWLSSPATRNSGWRSTSLPTSVTSSSSQTLPSTSLSTPWRFELDVKLTKGPIPTYYSLAFQDFKFRHVLWSWFCGTPALSKPGGYHHPSKKIPASKTCVMEVDSSIYMEVSGIDLKYS